MVPRNCARTKRGLQLSRGCRNLMICVRRTTRACRLFFRFTTNLVGDRYIWSTVMLGKAACGASDFVFCEFLYACILFICFVYLFVCSSVCLSFCFVSLLISCFCCCLFCSKKSLRAEVESLAATLVIRPVQPNPWPMFRFMDFLWRAPATFLFTLYMGED